MTILVKFLATLTLILNGGCSSGGDSPEVIRAIILTPESLSLAEEAQSADYTVKLQMRPPHGESIVVSVVSADLTVAVVNPPSLTFTSEDWNTAQTVSVTTVDDKMVNVPDRTVEITHAATGAGYDEITLGSLVVTATDDDTRGMTVSQSSRVLEEGGSATYTVALTSAPTGNVTVHMTSSSTDVVTVTGSLNFTPTSWEVAQTVTLRGTQNTNSVPTGATATIGHVVTGGDYEGVIGRNVAVRVLDDDSKAVTVSETALTVAEDSGEGTYTVVLGSRPTENVTVSVVSSTQSAVTVSSTSLVFTTDNWNTPQTVTVRGVNDAIDTPDRTSSITHGVAGGNYTGVPVPSVVTVTATDDDERGIRLSRGNFAVVEGGSAAYTVVLTSQPTEQVTVTVTLSENIAFCGFPGNSNGIGTFSTANWSESQRVVMIMYNDTIDQAEGADLSTRITHTAAGGDYEGLSVSITATATDNDRRRRLSSRDSFAESVPSLPFSPGQIPGLSLWLDANRHKASLSPDRGGWPGLSDLLVAQGGRESGELLAVTGQEGKVDLLSFIYPDSVSVKESSRDFGELKEVVIYEELLEEDERAKLQRYLSCRWQLPVVSGECL